MLRFILNETDIETDLPAGTLVLDFVRYHRHLMGTKIGCREGDCGACTVLVGEVKDHKLTYRSATSCLMSIGNAAGKHIVTVEGLNTTTLNPVQQAMSDEGATQCGFCTPGFVVSLAGFCLSDAKPSFEKAIASIDGNICRCTGYKSIERAAARVASLMEQRNGMDPIAYATQNQFFPAYFETIKERLTKMSMTVDGVSKSGKATAKFLGGGTDLYVQQHETMVHADINFLFNKKEAKGIYKDGHKCWIGGSATVTDLLESEILQQHFPKLGQFVKLVSSTPIRNMATVAGNFVNASPIGDFTIFFLALNARIVLSNGKSEREIPLRNLYKGYKQLDKSPDEYIDRLWFDLPDDDMFFNFEKVSKRTHLDIASVNTAVCISSRNGEVKEAGISAGGVAAVPLYLKKSSDFLKGKTLSTDLLDELVDVVQSEIAPISDARGTDQYKRLLLTQLIKSHFRTLFPALVDETVFSR